MPARFLQPPEEACFFLFTGRFCFGMVWRVAGRMCSALENGLRVTFVDPSLQDFRRILY